MIKNVRVPFAIHRPTNEFVDVDDVESGSKCNCFCPSCKSALIAKHGNKKVHHFAHLKTDVEIECDYSIYYSIRMMYIAKFKAHIENTPISLPSYVQRLDGYTRYNQLVSVSKTLISATTVNFVYSSGDIIVHDLTIDAGIKLSNGKAIGIYFYYDEHPVPAIERLQGLKFPILGIDITPLKNILLARTDTTRTNTQILLDYLASDHLESSWLHVPNNLDLSSILAERIHQIEEEFESELPHAASITLTKKRPMYKRGVSTFKCSSCNAEWNATQGYICNNCGGRGKIQN
ncbi:TPA: competence protein CoiA family protein [Photobacterium damselae]